MYYYFTQIVRRCEVKVLLVNLRPYVEVQGGMEKVLCEMSNALVTKGFEVACVCADKNEGLPYFDVSPRVKIHNIGDIRVKKSLRYKIKRIFSGNKKSRRSYDEAAISCAKASRVSSVYEAERPDVIICFSVKDAYVVKGYMDVQSPVITMFHSPPSVIFEYVDFDENMMRATESTECLQVLLPSFVDDLKKYINHNNIIVIGNAVPSGNCVLECGKRDVIVSVGRVSRLDKQQHLLIEAFSKISDKYPDWKVEFYGDTDGDKEYFIFCRDLIRKYGLENKVEFCGITNNVHKQLEQSSIFAFPSAFEGFGLALAEAMSAGLPAVGFKTCPAVNELIKDGSNGVLCEETVEGFARSLAELMDDADKRKRYGLQAKEDMKQYAPMKIWDQWEKLINKTVHDYKVKYKIQ